MTTNVLLIAIVVLVAMTINLRRERKKIEHLLATDDINVYIYLAPEAGIAPVLDVYSDEVLEQKLNAQWN